MKETQLCFEPSNKHIIISIRQNIYKRSKPGVPNEEKFLHFVFATPVIDIIQIPLTLPDDATGIAISVREDETKFEPLDIQLNVKGPTLDESGAIVES